MALHGRYTNGSANVQRATVTFRRQDLLWKTDAVLVGPGGKPRVKGLPIWSRDEAAAVGPTILDMMLREVVPVTEDLREQLGLPNDAREIAVWKQRPIASLWPKPVEKEKPLTKKIANERPKQLDHPFQPGCWRPCSR